MRFQSEPSVFKFLSPAHVDAELVQQVGGGEIKVAACQSTEHVDLGSLIGREAWETSKKTTIKKGTRKLSNGRFSCQVRFKKRTQFLNTNLCTV